jgi:hypothetical protein
VSTPLDLSRSPRLVEQITYYEVLRSLKRNKRVRATASERRAYAYQASKNAAEAASKRQSQVTTTPREEGT